MNLVDLNKLINSELTSKILKSDIQNDEVLINVNVENLYSTLLFLKTHESCKFKQLIDIVCADYPNSENRFKIYYLLLSHEKNIRIKIVINFKTEEKIPSITKLYPSANWMEREVFDMYGIKFKNHPDMRRILTDYGFVGFPLRKDFPLTGFNEVRYSEKDKKVVYEKVKLEQEYRNFDFESPWEGTRYLEDTKKKMKND
tara:strand:+ start:1097 stop:1696 length:600 start_codon:yes stop_codon:yes gene_type:complete